MSKPAAVDVEGVQDLDDRINRYAQEGPANDVEVFLPGFESVENAIK